MLLNSKLLILKIISKSDTKRFEMLKSFELNGHQFKKLKNFAHEKHVSFISTPFDIKSAKFLEQIVDAIKISSSTIIFSYKNSFR